MSRIYTTLELGLNKLSLENLQNLATVLNIQLPQFAYKGQKDKMITFIKEQLCLIGIARLNADASSDESSDDNDGHLHSVIQTITNISLDGGAPPSSSSTDPQPSLFSPFQGQSQRLGGPIARAASLSVASEKSEHKTDAVSDEEKSAHKTDAVSDEEKEEEEEAEKAASVHSFGEGPESTDIKITVKCFNGVQFDVVVDKNTEADYLRSCVQDHIKLDRYEITLIYNGKKLHAQQRLSKRGLVSGSVVHAIQYDSSGGGKRGHSQSSGSVKMVIKPEPLQTDISCVKEALSMTNIDIPGWIASLNLDKLEGLQKAISDRTHTGNMDYTMRLYAPFIKEYAELQVLLFFFEK